MSILRVILSFILGVMMTACGQVQTEFQAAPKTLSSLEKIQKQGFIRIGVYGDKPPLGYVDSYGHHVGYDVLFAKRIAQELFDDEDKVRFVLVQADNREQFLKSNQVDVILASFTQTPERAKEVDFALPYMKASLSVVVPKESKITKLADLMGKTVIVNEGSRADLYLSQKYPQIKIWRFKTIKEAFAALRSGKAVALADDNTLLFAWAKDNSQFKVGIRSLDHQEAIAPAVAKGNNELKNFINHLIQSLAQEQFFHRAYSLVLRDAFGTEINPDEVVVEGGQF